MTLIVLGAILSFTDLVDNLVGTNLDTVGWILLLAGILSIVVGLIMNGQRARSHTVVERRGGPDVVERRDDLP
ncbi:DUF6458 family protein [Actinomycetota bacterium]